MRSKLFLLVVLTLALPLAAFADNSETINFGGGTLTGSSFGESLTGSQLTSVEMGGGPLATDPGTVTFSTYHNGPFGPIVTGNVIVGTGFLPGGTITVVGNSSDPDLNGVLFTGMFNQGGTWTYVTQPDGTHLYTLTGTVTGSTGGGNSAAGTLSFSINTGTRLFTGVSSGPSSGTLSLAVPEPGELSLLGTGFIGLMGAIRRKMKA